MTGVSRFRIGVIAVSLLALAGAGVAVFAPGMVPSPVIAAVTSPSPGVLIAMLAAFGGLLWLVSLQGRTPYSDAPMVPRREPTPDAPRLGAAVDATLERATDLDAARGRRVSTREDLRETLFDLAVDTYAGAAACSPEMAERAVETGAWTDDRRAAATLSDDEGPDLPLWLWLIDLFRGESAFRRRVRHTLSAIDELSRADPGTVEALAEEGDT
ncbi:hypothetical protein HWV23_14370 [Natronomonas halophila]|uniref:DUF7269 family protein n=1 Tax=Natronomonas halophila TaxID=2747817 RepID=UPI0015B6F31D|nr:hypothetical protein [Natronomonas halophila]QLD86858.1 hypothetical protein HWV23_14370 [Natronomonas halophila]